jgi:membrane associated rhomboid family serine protease
MGIQNREYYRSSKPSPWSFSGAPVITGLIIAYEVVFILKILITQPIPARAARVAPSGGTRPAVSDNADDAADFAPMFRESIVQKWFQLDTDKVLHGQVWRLITHGFCHDRYSIFHIVVNMFLLFWFGRALELMYGHTEFLLFYIAGILFAAAAYIGLDLAVGTRIPAVGASGAVMAAMMLYTLHFPGEKIWIGWWFQLEMRWVMLIYAFYELHPVLLMLAGDRFFTGIAHSAHLGGMAFGLMYWYFGWRLVNLPGLRALPTKARVRVRRERVTPRAVAPFRPRPPSRPARREPAPPDHDAMSIDEILAKISASGRESLTEEEMAMLQSASERLKRRAR